MMAKKHLVLPDFVDLVLLSKALSLGWLIVSKVAQHKASHSLLPEPTSDDPNGSVSMSLFSSSS